MSRKWKNILIFSLYVVLAIVFYFLQHINEYFGKCTFIIVFLCYVRPLIWCAPKPLGLFHGNPIKYYYQKRDNLKKYEEKLKILEKILVVLFFVFLVFAIKTLIGVKL